MSLIKKMNRRGGEKFRLEVALHGLAVRQNPLLINKQIEFCLFRRDKVVNSKIYFLHNEEMQIVDDERLVMLITLFKDTNGKSFEEKKYSIQVKETESKRAAIAFNFNASQYANNKDYSVELKASGGSRLHVTISCPLEADYQRPESDISNQDIPDVSDLSMFDDDISETKSMNKDWGQLQISFMEETEHEEKESQKTAETNDSFESDISSLTNGELWEETYENQPMKEDHGKKDERILKLQQDISELKKSLKNLQQYKKIEDDKDKTPFIDCDFKMPSPARPFQAESIPELMSWIDASEGDLNQLNTTIHLIQTVQMLLNRPSSAESSGKQLNRHTGNQTFQEHCSLSERVTQFQESLFGLGISNASTPVGLKYTSKTSDSESLSSENQNLSTQRQDASFNPFLNINSQVKQQKQRRNSIGSVPMSKRPNINTNTVEAPFAN